MFNLISFVVFLSIILIAVPSMLKKILKRPLKPLTRITRRILLYLWSLVGLIFLAIALRALLLYLYAYFRFS